MFNEFKDFAFKGSLLDVAVGFVLGVAFATVVTSLVTDVLTPFIAAIFGQPDFSDLAIELGGGVIRYGNFINALISFLLVVLALFFFVVKPYNSLMARRKSGREPEAEPSEDIVLLREIRDTLRQKT
jgi:large conductance mechanosensitive channel